MEKVYWFMFLAKPLPDSPDFESEDGGFINAWVAHPDDAIAEQIARDAITDEKWSVEQIEEKAVISCDTYASDPENLAHFEQALVDGHCLVIYTWDSEFDSDDKKPPA